MSEANEEDKIILPHHEQLPLCTTRLPYRQGRKLTAVKAYTINNESRHLLIFGIPSLNLRQEAKSLFKNYGKLQLFQVTTKYPTEKFTDNYHAVYEFIQAARMAKKKLDTTNFYGGSLHICYAPELETIEETRNKLLQRKKDVMNRLKNLQREEAEALKKKEKEKTEPTKEFVIPEIAKMYMGDVNVIGVGKQIKDVLSNKRKKMKQPIIEKKFKANPVTDKTKIESTVETTNIGRHMKRNMATQSEKSDNCDIEIVDCTSTERETVSNIHEALNYNKFGNEIVRKIPQKPVNKINFQIGRKL